MANSADPDQLAKPPDLDLHCFQRQDISGFSRTSVKTIYFIPYIFRANFAFYAVISYNTKCRLRSSLFCVCSVCKCHFFRHIDVQYFGTFIIFMDPLKHLCILSSNFRLSTLQQGVKGNGFGQVLYKNFNNSQALQFTP